MAFRPTPHHEIGDTEGTSSARITSAGLIGPASPCNTCILAHAAQIAQVPARKPDVKDGAWIAQLLEHGLIRASFVPPAPIRALRDLTRYRKVRIEERPRHANRLPKVREDAGIKLASVASRLLGASGRAMLDALVAGTTDPALLADLPAASCGESCRRGARRWPAASAPLMPSSSVSSWPTSITLMRPSTRSAARSMSP